MWIIIYLFLITAANGSKENITSSHEPSKLQEAQEMQISLIAKLWLPTMLNKQTQFS